MFCSSALGLLTLAVSVSGNLFGFPFPPIPAFPSFPTFPSFPSFPSIPTLSPFDDGFSGQLGFNSFRSPFFPFGSPSPNLGSQIASLATVHGGSSNPEGDTITTIRIIKTRPDGTKISESVQTYGPNRRSPPNGSNRPSSSPSSPPKERPEPNNRPSDTVTSQGGVQTNTRPSGNTPTQGIAVGEPNPSAPINNQPNLPMPGAPMVVNKTVPLQRAGAQSKSQNFGGFYPVSTGISSMASSASSSNFATSSSTKTLPDGTRVTETVTYDSHNPGKVTKVIKRVTPDGKVTTSYA